MVLARAGEHRRSACADADAGSRAAWEIRLAPFACATLSRVRRAVSKGTLLLDPPTGMAVLLSIAGGERDASTWATTLNVALDGTLQVHDGARVHRGKVIVSAPGVRRVSSADGPVLTILFDADVLRTRECARDGRPVVTLESARLVERAVAIAEGVLRGDASATTESRRLGAQALSLAPLRLADPRIEAMVARSSLAPAPLAELAADVGLSASHLSELFSATVGLPHKSWLLWQRVKRSLLASSGTGAARAAAAGFSDQAHMVRTYTRLLGYTPGALTFATR